MAARVWIAVFGDVHGAWDAMYLYCQYCAPENDRRAPAHIGAVLQCGDIGLFSAASTLDKATRRYALQDSSELGANDFLAGLRTIPIPTYFVRGNHEDFSLLPSCGAGHVAQAEGLYHVYLKPVQVEVGGQRISVAGLGGIAARGKNTAREWVDAENPGRYFTRHEVEALERLRMGSVDILICHDGPAGSSLRAAADAGSRTIADLVQRLRPRLMFYGHYHDPPDPHRIGDTLCICMNHRHAWRLPNRDGGMGLVDPETLEFVWARPLS